MAAWLTRDGDEITQSAIAMAAEIHPMQISQMLKALEGKGLLRKGQNPKDARVAIISLTREGTERLREAMPVAIEVQTAMFGNDGKALALIRKVEMRIKD
jgi:DNA-binding MarR family transcriptional regulator